MSLYDIRAREQAATDGPWFAVRYYVGAGKDQGDPDAEIATAGYKPDAAFIAHARQDIPKLLTAVDVLADLIAALEGSDEFTSDPRLLAKLLRDKLNEALA